MIKITCSKDLYTYNAYHLAKAFFPDETANVYTDASLDASVIFDINKNVIRIREAETKAQVDKSIYLALRKITGKDLPWGLLTGVRPTKPAMAKVREKMGREEFIRWYGEKSLVSAKKAGLAWDIAKRENDILSACTPPGGWTDSFSIYIGIPFCPGICSYCSFSLGTISRYMDRADEYTDALCREIEGCAGLCAGVPPTCIYIGGGTPTCLTAGQLEKIMRALNENFDLSSLAEFSVEAGRPDTITKEKLEILKALGADRISVNPQTMQQRTLDAVGRSHSVAQVYEAFETARACGFDDINMDLIAGLPAETVSDMEDTLDRVLALKPENLTVHALSIKRRAQFEKQYASERSAEEMIELAYAKAAQCGMEPYYLYRQKSIAGNFENMGYSKPGRECLYNILTMEEVQTVYGLGAGAQTKMVFDKYVPNPQRALRPAKILRSSNIKDVDGYINNIDEMLERKRALKQERA